MISASTSPGQASVIALVVGIAITAAAAHRQSQRDRLELGDAPPAAAAPQLDRSSGRQGRDRAAGLRRDLPPGAQAQSVSPPQPSEVGVDSTDRQTVLTPELEAAATEVFGEARPGLVECLRGERVRRPGVSGKLSVSLFVEVGGLVRNVDLGPSPVRSEAFDECTTLTLASLVFPAEIAPRDVSITFDLR